MSVRSSEGLTPWSTSVEAELDALYAQNLAGLAFLDTSLRFRRVNRRFAEISGLAAEDHLGRTVREALPRLAGTCEPIFERVLLTGEGVDGLEITSDTPAQPGVTRVWLASCRAVRGPTGEILGLQTVVQEITARKRAEEALRESEQDFRQIFDNMSEGAAVHEPIANERGEVVSYRHVAANPAWERLTGLKRSEVMGRDVREFLPRIEPIWVETFAKVASTGESAHVEAFAKDLNNWYSVSVYCPRPGQAATIFSNVTERKHAEEVLRRNAETFAAVVEQSPLGIYTVDADFRIRHVSAGAMPVFATCQPVIGRDFSEVIRTLWPEPFATEAIDVFRHTLETGEPYVSPGVTEQRRDLGAIESYEWQTIRVTLSDGRYGVVCYFFDSTRLRQALTAARETAAALAQREAALAAADRQKDVFLATLSHELRNPLAPIRTAAQILASPHAKPEQLRSAGDVIQRQVRHMAWLLDDLLDVARITQGKLELKRERVGLIELIGTAVESARSHIDEKHHRLSVALPSADPVLDVDRLRIPQLITNLLTNAAKYTDPHGHIELSAAVEGGRLAVRVRDNGIGIETAALPRVFDMFAQVQEARTRSEGGLGIGLALVKALAELHGGTVEAYSAGVGTGSTFTLYLPIDSHRVAADGTPREQALVDRVPRRVLVVDDNRDAADTLGMSLEMSGHDVAVAYDAASALARARAFRPEVALLDVGMPEMDGHELARALRAEPWADGLYLVAVTGWGQDEDRRQSSDAGFDTHLTKPVDPGEIAALLGELGPGGRRSSRANIRIR